MPWADREQWSNEMKRHPRCKKENGHEKTDESGPWLIEKDGEIWLCRLVSGGLLEDQPMLVNAEKKEVPNAA